MRILILGGDGYLGWPTAMHLNAKGHDVAVADDLPGLRAGVSEAQPEHDVVQALLQEAHHGFAGHARAAYSFAVVATELALHDSVAEARALLLAQLKRTV